MARPLLVLAVAALLAGPTHAQCNSFDNPGIDGVTFNSLVASDAVSPWSNGSTANGVFSIQARTSSATPPPKAVGACMVATGNSNTGGLYSYGVAAGTDRAFVCTTCRSACTTSAFGGRYGVGARDGDHAKEFVRDLAERLTGRV